MENAFDFTFLTWNTYHTIEESVDNDENLKKYVTKCDEFTIYYMRNCAFIPNELIIPFELFVNKINEFRNAARNCNRLLIKEKLSGSTSAADDKLFQECYDTMKIIHDGINKDSEYSHDLLVTKTRQYYERLEIK